MDNFQKNIDNLIEKILNEEINRKAYTKSRKLVEDLKGNQNKLDVAEPKGKLTSADFKKLRSGKKKEVDEYYYSDDNDSEDSENDVTSNQFASDEPKWSVDRNPKMIGSFDDEHGWFDELDYPSKHDTFSDYDEEEFDEFDPFYEKYGKEQRWFAPGKEGKRFFDTYKDKYQKPFRVRRPKSMEEAETEEGNAFSGALANAKATNKKSFKVDGKEYPVKESKKLKLKLTESELVDLIEKIVLEQEKEEKVKKNIKKEDPKGMKETKKAQDKSKKENQQSLSDVKKKMDEYMKDGSKAKFETSPEYFPKGNGELAKMEKMAYEPDKNVKDYQDNFTAAGLENLVYDEIHPDEDWVDKNVVGSELTGNSPKYGNAVETDVNEKRNKMRKDNLLGAVKQMAYNKAPQPTTTDKEKNPAKKKFERNFGKGSDVKAVKILNQLESTEEKDSTKINEDIEKMKNLIEYSRKTQ